jgi:hypothetical protein
MVMQRQAHLDGGHLRGEAQYSHVTKSELEDLRGSRLGSDGYVTLGKRIVSFLYPPVSSFIDTLRAQYGQYWLPELLAWDSRRESLGSYCATSLWLRWKETVDANWQRFEPTDRSQTIVVERLPRRGNEEYLTYDDWQRLQKTFSSDSTVNLPLKDCRPRP